MERGGGHGGLAADVPLARPRGGRRVDCAQAGRGRPGDARHSARHLQVRRAEERAGRGGQEARARLPDRGALRGAVPQRDHDVRRRRRRGGRRAQDVPGQRRSGVDEGPGHEGGGGGRGWQGGGDGGGARRAAAEGAVPRLLQGLLEDRQEGRGQGDLRRGVDGPGRGRQGRGGGGLQLRAQGRAGKPFWVSA